MTTENNNVGQDTQSQSRGKRIGTVKKPKQFNWQDCVNNFTLQQTRDLAKERAVDELTIEGLRNQRLIGSCYVEKWNKRCICFPISDENGDVFRAHCRSPQPDANGKYEWAYEPDKDPQKRPIPALVFGNPDTATRRLLFESQWDAISAIDKLRLLDEIDQGETCLIMTRGTDFKNRLEAFKWPADLTVYAFPQNDPGGGKWLAKVLEDTGGAYIVETPPPHKDIGEWIKNGSATAYGIEGAMDNADFQAPPRQQSSTGTSPQPNASTPPPLRPMPSWISYGNMEVDRTLYHIGEGFLEVGCFIMLIGQSYVGKSTLLTQLTISLSIGKSWLFLQVERALKILVVQAEDVENKRRKMGRMYRRMGLTPEEIKLADKNTAVLTIRELQGQAVINEIERHAEVFKPDIICINPMTSYLPGVYKDDVINTFLRVHLTPMLDRVEASGIVVHHPPKPVLNAREPKDLTAFELQYGVAGMAALTNAPRGNVFLVHVDGDVFKLSVGKGFDDLGTKETSVYLRRSRDQDGVMLWELCDPKEAEEAGQKKKERTASAGAAKPFLAYDAVLKLLKATEKYAPEQIYQLVKKGLGRGENWAKRASKQLWLEKKLAKSEKKIPGKKGASLVFYHLPTVLEPATGLDAQEEEEE
jgi:hypothetical protein